MVKHIEQPSYHNGTGERVLESDRFVYELTIYYLASSRAECIYSRIKYFDKAINSYIKYIKRDGLLFSKSISLLSAPKIWLLENNYKLYENNRRKRESSKGIPAKGGKVKVSSKRKGNRAIN